MYVCARATIKFIVKRKLGRCFDSTTVPQGIHSIYCGVIERERVSHIYMHFKYICITPAPLNSSRQELSRHLAGTDRRLGRRAQFNRFPKEIHTVESMCIAVGDVPRTLIILYRIHVT